MPCSSFFLDSDCFLVCISPIDGAIQKIVPMSIEPHALYFSQHPPLVGHHGESYILNTIRRVFSWPRTTNNAYATFKDCSSCARNGKRLTKTRYLELFTAKAPLKFIARNNHGQLPKDSGRSPIRCSNRWSLLEASASRHWNPLRCMSRRSFPISGLHHTAFPLSSHRNRAPICWLNLQEPFHIPWCQAPKQQPRIHKQLAKARDTTISRLRHYIAEYQRNWDIFEYPLTYAYNNQNIRSLSTKQFRHFPSWNPSGPASFEQPLSSPYAANTLTPPATTFFFIALKQCDKLPINECRPHKNRVLWEPISEQQIRPEYGPTNTYQRKGLGLLSKAMKS